MNPIELKTFMGRKNLKTRDLVEKLGVSEPLVYKWLNSTRSIPKWLPLALRGAYGE